VSWTVLFTNQALKDARKLATASPALKQRVQAHQHPTPVGVSAAGGHAGGEGVADVESLRVGTNGQIRYGDSSWAVPGIDQLQADGGKIDPITAGQARSLGQSRCVNHRIGASHGFTQIARGVSALLQVLLSPSMRQAGQPVQDQRKELSRGWLLGFDGLSQDRAGFFLPRSGRGGRPGCAAGPWCARRDCGW